jgi:SAM-dependent methyltransferase
MKDAAAQIFRDNWSIYQEIIASNYMYHLEIGNYIDQLLRTHKTSGRVLDLGCGDARQLASRLAKHPVQSYTGIDLSGAALALAAGNLTGAAASVELQEGPMEVLMKSAAGPFDLIHSSYAVHHLQDEEKKTLLADCRQQLTPGGALLLIDVYRETGQPREAYIEAYTRCISTSWHSLSAEAAESVCTHVRDYDFPASITEMMDWAAEAGFRVTEFPLPDRWHRFLLLEKSSV